MAKVRGSLDGRALDLAANAAQKYIIISYVNNNFLQMRGSLDGRALDQNYTIISYVNNNFL